jgi:hypothetical protein
MDKVNNRYKNFNSKYGQFIMAIALFVWGVYVYSDGIHADKTEGVLFIIVGFGYLIYG